MQRRGALIALLGAAAAVVLIIVLSDGGSDEKEPTEVVNTTQEERGARPGSSETAGSDAAEGANRRRSARGRARERARRRARAGRGRSDQGRLGAQTGGSPVQGGRTENGRPGAAVATINVVGGAPVGGVQRVRFGKDERVRLIVRSDADDVVEIAGYGLTRRVTAGGSARFYFKTSKEGIFEIRLTRGGRTQIGVLGVG